MPKHNYIQYETPKAGVFKIYDDTNEYIPGAGWKQVEKEIQIIGEDKTNYIEKIIYSSIGVWRNEKVINCRYTIRVGPHKSRLVKWIPNQLKLF